ncbi:MAG: sigma 54-interacting transcriptional regulator [Acidobacteriota bacterium]
MIDRYGILRPLEPGPDVRVYLVEDRWQGGSQRVLTLLPERDLNLTSWRLELEKLFALRSSLDHPNLVPVTDIAFRGRRLGLVSEFLRPQPPQPPPQAPHQGDAIQLALQLVRVVEYVHRRGCLLGSLKPSQLFISGDARLTLNLLLPRSQMEHPFRLNTLRYAAPEFLDSRSETREADLYSLGMLLYRIFSGDHPFGDENREDLIQKQRVASPLRPRRVHPDIPAEIEELIQQLIRKQPKLRLSSSSVVRSVLEKHAVTIPAEWVKLRSGLVGRGKQRSDFRLSLGDYLESPETRFLVVAGKSGMGKTRLAEHFESTAKIHGAATCSIAHLPGQEPFQVFRELLARIQPKEKRDAGKVFQPEFFSTTFWKELKTLLGDQPLVLRVEDLQWLDEASFQTYRSLVRRKDLSVLVIATLRTDCRAGYWNPLRQELKGREMLVECELESLTENEVRELVANLLGEVPSEETLLKIQVDCLGNPFYVYEFLRAWNASGRLTRRNGEWHWQRRLGEDPIPTTVSTNIESRLSRLDDLSLRILEFLSLIRRPVELGLLSRLLAVALDPVEKRITVLERQDFAALQAGGDELLVGLAHDWIGEVIRNRLDPSSRRDLHRRVALTLEESLEGTRNLFLTEALVKHFLGAADVPRARRYFWQATTALEEAGLYKKAAFLICIALARGMASPCNWKTARKTIELLYRSGQMGRCISFARHVLSLLELADSRKETWVLSVLARIYVITGQQARAVSSCQRALARIKEEDDPGVYAEFQAILLSALSRAGRQRSARGVAVTVERLLIHGTESHYKLNHALFLFSYLIEGRFEDSVRHLVRSICLSLEEQRHPSYPGHLVNLGTLWLYLGRWTKARRVLGQALRMARKMGNLELEVFARSVDCVAQRKEGRHKSAIKNLKELLGFNERLNRNRHLATELRIELAKNLNYQLLPEAALQQLDQAHQIGCNDPDYSSTMDAKLARGWSWLLLGRPDRAQESIQNMDPERIPREKGRVYLLQARIRLALGELQSAWDASCQARKAFSRELPYYRLRCLLLQGEIVLARKEPERATSLVGGALKAARNHFYFPLMARSCALYGKCVSEQGQPEKGRIYCLRALQLAGRLDQPGLRVQIYRTLGEIETARNRLSEARANYTGALQILKSKLLQLSAPYRESFRRRCIEPIEAERRRLTKTGTVRPPRLFQELGMFVSDFRETETSPALGQRLLELVLDRLPYTSGGFLIRQSPRSPIELVASRGRCVPPQWQATIPNSSPKTTPNSRPFVKGGEVTIDVAMSSSGGSELLLHLEDKNREVSDVEFDFLKCLVAVTGLVLPNTLPSEMPATGQGGGLELAKGKRIVGDHALMRKLFGEVRRMAPTGATLLISGETGTGKELVARALHHYSRRSRGPFVPVNCSGFPADLVESELFGYLRGSFTGAICDRRGLFEAASGGTLFLDEVASMPIEAQSRLLRVLEEKAIRRIGEHRERPVDVRMVAATNQPLERLVREGSFRADLYHRLNVYQIVVPPLRQRASDIPLLAQHFLEELSREEGTEKKMTSDALSNLLDYPFPGNVRELRNVIESAYHLSPGSTLTLREVSNRLVAEPTAGSQANRRAEGLVEALALGRASFWDDVKEPFLERELCRADVRAVVSSGLAASGGSYRRLVEYFHLPARDYKRLLTFLSHHGCKVDFRPFRNTGS